MDIVTPLLEVCYTTAKGAKNSLFCRIKEKPGVRKRVQVRLCEHDKSQSAGQHQDCQKLDAASDRKRHNLVLLVHPIGIFDVYAFFKGTVDVLHHKGHLVSLGTSKDICLIWICLESQVIVANVWK